jgi:hypothetical protein
MLEAAIRDVLCRSCSPYIQGLHGAAENKGAKQ